MGISLKQSAGLRSFLFMACISLFALFSPNESPYHYVGLVFLVLAAGIIVYNSRNLKDLLHILGFRRITYSRYSLLVIAFVVGGVMGFYHRNVLGLQMMGWPLTGFAIISVVIGFTEELIFRGYLQTQLEKINLSMAVVIAAIAHAAYKVLIFASLQHLIPVDLFNLFFWTFLAGLPAGFLKIWSRSTLTPMIGHGAFDLVVYGDSAVTPWWVWA